MKNFLKKHGACKEAREWAENLTKRQAWETAPDEWLIWGATCKGVLTDRELHEFMLFCAEQVKHLMTDPRSLKALEIKRLWLDGKASDEELAAARDAAKAAAWAAAWAAAGAAAWDAAWVTASAAAGDAAWAAYWAAYGAAARSIAWATAWAAAWAAARDAAEAAAWVSAGAAARDAAFNSARSLQAQWLRTNTKPNLED